MNGEVEVNSNPFQYRYGLLGGGLSGQLLGTFSLVLSVGNEFSASIVPDLDTATITITDVSCKLHRNPQPGLQHFSSMAHHMLVMCILSEVSRHVVSQQLHVISVATIHFV